ncbi:hypothetical protein MPL1032_50041 [Mesorhizobium plurifarium]|uniref:Uncharacterized protein n=1 Tax=Mesorhizobium plurifarium TaxID=69974 RepID=A0A0K2W5R4_MESPL|nr:hypothetical protein MPL1032_50041 [Mesorhizobium plurifarium]
MDAPIANIDVCVNVNFVAAKNFCEPSGIVATKKPRGYSHAAFCVRGISAGDQPAALACGAAVRSLSI